LIIGSPGHLSLATWTNRPVVDADLREAGDVDELSHVTVRTGGGADPGGPTKGIRAPLRRYRRIHSQVSVLLTNGFGEYAAYTASTAEHPFAPAPSGESRRFDLHPTLHDRK
jgi:hypothetical protein